MKCERSMVVVPQLTGSARSVATKQRWLRLVFTNQKMDAFVCIQMMMNMYAQIVVQKAHWKVQRRICTKFNYKLLSYDLFQEVLIFLSQTQRRHWLHVSGFLLDVYKEDGEFNNVQRYENKIGQISEKNKFPRQSAYRHHVLFSPFCFRRC